MMHRVLKRLSPVLKVLLKWYQGRTRIYRYHGLSVLVRPGVFPPRFLISTRLLLDYLDGRSLSSLRFLELGAGCGIISLLAAKKGAIVTASDINPVAVENIRENAARNKLEISLYLSDLFEKIPNAPFDLIVISPPFYPRAPLDYNEMAWYCGADFEYFRRLFPQLKEVIRPATEVLFLLSEDCNIGKIRAIAAESGLRLSELHRERRMWEWNYLFHVS